jgi:hypothetical protein
MVRRKAGAVDKQGLWSGNAMLHALKMIREQNGSIRKACSLYAVPKTTLLRRLHGKVPDDAKGRPTKLTDHEESRLEEYILNMESVGFGLTIEDVCKSAYDIASVNGHPEVFNKEKKAAGYDWYQGFLRRHPRLSLRKPEGLAAVRSDMLNHTVMDDYFGKLYHFLTQHDLLNKPRSLFNCDESGFSTVPSTTPRILGLKGKKMVHSKTSRDRGENITIVATCSAAGQYLPPFHIFKGKRVSQSLMASAVPDSLFGYSDSGFINTELFNRWFEDIFIKHAPKERPIALFLDGHSSHLNIRTVEMAKTHGVEMFCFPPHTTNWTQPLDRAIFRPLKQEYSKQCQIFLKNNPGRVVTRHEVCGLFKIAHNKTCTITNAEAAFRGTGIYPYNPNAIPSEAYGPSRVNILPPLESNKQVIIV